MKEEVRKLYQIGTTSEWGDGRIFAGGKRKNPKVMGATEQGRENKEERPKKRAQRVTGEGGQKEGG